MVVYHLQIHLEIYKSESHKVKQLCITAKRDFYQKKIDDCNDDQKKLFRIAEELMHASKEAVLPTHSDAEALADQFADFFDDKITKICQEFSESPEMAEEDLIYI